MTREEYNEKSFDELMDLLDGERDDIHTYEDMKDFAKYHIDEENLYLAIYVLEGIQKDPAEWYLYDYTMGTMGVIRGITCKEDVEDLIEE